MSGWITTPADGWPSIAEALASTGAPWPEAAAITDLRWHEDRGIDIPGRPTLRARWRWTDWAVRTLLQREEDWRDPIRRQPAASRPPAHRQPAASVPPASARTNADSEADSASAPPAHRQPAASVPPADLHTRGDPPSPSPSPSPGEGGARPPEGAPRWASGWPGNEPMPVLGAVAAVTEAIRQKPVLADRLGGDATQVRALWDSLGRPPLRELVGEVELVAAWAREGPSAANDIRGINERGESWGTDRSRSPATVLKPALWHDRLDQALAWEQAGRPTKATGPPAAASAPRDEPIVVRTPEQEADDDEFWRDPDAYIRLHGSHSRAK